LSIALLAACSPSPPPPAGAAAPPPPAVGVITVSPQPVALQTELPGRVEALRTAQVRARVGGVVQERLFREGSDVQAGQVLMRIDPAPYQAALDAAQAQLQRAEAAAGQARLTAERYQPLAAIQAVSQQDLANAEAASRVAQADVAAARAAVQTARLNLGHATVTAPIAGRIGRALVTEGALVSATEATPLAVIQQVGRLRQLHAVQRRAAAACGARSPPAACSARATAWPCASCWKTAASCRGPGRLLFSDLTVDAGTGQVTLRAEVPNPEGLLLPGPVRARAPGAGHAAGRRAGAAAGGDAHAAGRHAAGGRRRRPAAAAHGAHRRRDGRPVDRRRGPAGRRTRHRRRLPEAGRPRLAGQARALAATGGPRGSARQRRGQPLSRDGAWPASSSTAPSSRG
jgi:RND family efflux transporter MFP subunit